jgi:hypothetical protein
MTARQAVCGNAAADGYAVYLLGKTVNAMTNYTGIINPGK